MSAFDATTETAWLMPLFNRTALVVEGPDRKSWLNGLLTCDVSKLTQDAGMYGLSVHKNGRIAGDLYLFETEDKLIMFAPASVAEAMQKALDAYLIMEDATIALSSHVLAAVLGPKAAEVARQAQATAVKLIVRSYDGWGVPAVLVAGDAEGNLHALLAEATKAVGGEIGTEEQWNILRTRGFIPEFGVDFDSSMYPQEAGLETRAVSFSKGCYLGQEVVCMLEMRGQVRRKLALISYEGDPLPPNSKVLSTQNDAAGETKSAVVVHHETRQTLGFAMVKRTLADVGTELLVVGEGGATRVARVVERTWP